MRYEHIELHLSTATCGVLKDAVEEYINACYSDLQVAEMTNLFNELRSRLQRRDQDPHAIIPPTDQELMA